MWPVMDLPAITLLYSYNDVILERAIEAQQIVQRYIKLTRLYVGLVTVSEYTFVQFHVLYLQLMCNCTISCFIPVPQLICKQLIFAATKNTLCLTVHITVYERVAKQGDQIKVELNCFFF